jgi:hypothetical protein
MEHHVDGGVLEQGLRRPTATPGRIVCSDEIR